MKVRALPPLQPLCERHNHVVLLWDERIEGRALLGVGAQRSILVDTPRSGDWALWEAFIQESESKSAWSFGWLGYDLHESLDLAAESECPSPVPAHPSAWPLMHWWEPEVVLEWAPGQETPSVGGWRRHAPGSGNHDVPGRGARANPKRFRNRLDSMATPDPLVVSRGVRNQIQRRQDRPSTRRHLRNELVHAVVWCGACR